MLSHLLTKAIEWQWIDKRPATLKRFSENRGRISYLTVEQAQRLVTAAMHDQNPHIYPFVVIGLETSMRKSEILSIRPIEHVDFQRRVIYIQPRLRLAKPTTSGIAPITSHPTRGHCLGRYLHDTLQMMCHTVALLVPERAHHLEALSSTLASLLGSIRSGGDISLTGAHGDIVIITAPPLVATTRHNVNHPAPPPEVPTKVPHTPPSIRRGISNWAGRCRYP